MVDYLDSFCGSFMADYDKNFESFGGVSDNAASMDGYARWRAT